MHSYDCRSEKLVNSYQTAWCQNSDDSIFHSHKIGYLNNISCEDDTNLMGYDTELFNEQLPMS